MTNSLHLIDDIILHSKTDNKPFLVDARFPESNTSLPVVVFVHGFKGFKDWGHWNKLADHIANSGFCVIKMNLSHNGTTPETPLDFSDLEAFSNNTFTTELSDVGVMIDYLFSDGCSIPNINKDKLTLIGHSRGGGLVLLKASQDKRVKSVITWASVSDYANRFDQSALDEWKEKGIYHIYNGRTKQQMPMKYKIVEDYYDNKEKLDIYSAVKGLDIPILHIHGTEDPTVNVKEAEDLNSWNKKSQLHIIEGADHVFGGQHPFKEEELPEHSKELLNKTISFLKSN